MATLYPNTIDGTAQLPNVSGTMSQDGTAGGADHAVVATNQNTAIIALENTLGTTAGTSVISAFKAGQTALPIQSGTLGVIVTAGTFNNLTFGTPLITGGTANSQVLGTPTLQGAVVNTANIAANAVSQGSIALGTIASTLGVADGSLGIGSITLTTTGGQCLVNGLLTIYSNTIAAWTIGIFSLYLDGTVVFNTSTYVNDSAIQRIGVPISYISTPAAGAHTWQVKGHAGTTISVPNDANGVSNFSVIELKK